MSHGRLVDWRGGATRRGDRDARARRSRGSGGHRGLHAPPQPLVGVRRRRARVPRWCRRRRRPWPGRAGARHGCRRHLGERAARPRPRRSRLLGRGDPGVLRGGRCAARARRRDESSRGAARRRGPRRDSRRGRGRRTFLHRDRPRCRARARRRMPAGVRALDHTQPRTAPLRHLVLPRAGARRPRLRARRAGDDRVGVGSTGRCVGAGASQGPRAHLSDVPQHRGVVALRLDRGAVRGRRRGLARSAGRAGRGRRRAGVAGAPAGRRRRRVRTPGGRDRALDHVPSASPPGSAAPWDEP